MPGPAPAALQQQNGGQIGQLLHRRVADLKRVADFSPANSPLSERTINGQRHTPGGSMAGGTPSGGRNPIRRRLRSPAMMSAPFKSSLAGGSPAPQLCTHAWREEDESQLVDGLSTLFVSPAPNRGWGSKLGGLGTPMSMMDTR